MTRSVLCAVDLNDPSDAAVLERAAKLADMDGAQLDVMTVVPDFGESYVAGFFEPDFHDRMMESAHEALVRMSEEVLGPERNADVRHIVAIGSAYQGILDTATSAGSDLIVIGAHKPDLKDFLLGPNAAHVVKHAPCSVYVVRTP